MAALQTPPRAIEDRRPDMWSLGRGMGILGWGDYLALSQGEELLTVRETEVSALSRYFW